MMEQIHDPAAIDSWIEKSHKQPVLFYKHSFTCPICAAAKEEIETFLEQNPDQTCVWMDVVGDRPVSNHLAEVTGIEHKSPQAILFKEGNPIWNASHRDITFDALKRQLL